MFIGETAASSPRWMAKVANLFGTSAADQSFRASPMTYMVDGVPARVDCSACRIHGLWITRVIQMKSSILLLVFSVASVAQNHSGPQDPRAGRHPDHPFRRFPYG